MISVIKRLLPSIIALVLLVSIVAISKDNPKNTTPTEPAKTTSIVKDNKEMRAVWVTYMDLDMQNTNMSYNAFISKFKHIADTSKAKGFNTLIVQIRPFADAFYSSQYFPYSHLLTGIQGKNPGYDPLKYMCHYSHKIGLGIHAWINPYRVKISNSPKKLAKNHPYLNNKDIGIKYNNEIYLNPASNDARELIKNGIREVIKNYDVDGIQFDDYFYPTTDENFDKKSYDKYVSNVGAGKAISLQKWRTANVNILIAEVYQLIHRTKENIVFGISPQGNIDNNDDLCADVKSWCCKSGYIDYICPQLYYSLDNPALKFQDALNQWKSLKFSNNVTLYIGIAGYKTGTGSDDGTWENSDTILKKELELIRQNDINGFMFYSFADLEREPASKEVSNMVKLLD